MNDVKQIVTIKLLNAISSASQNYNNTYKPSNELNTFDFVLKNMLGNSLNTGNNTSCNECIKESMNAGNATNTLDTILTNINNNRVEETTTKQPSSKMDEAMKLLNEQLGKKYVWGANGPESFDCSGLTRYIYKEALGKNIPRVSYDQAEYGQAVSRDNLQVGDLVFFDTLNKGRVSHVGIYVGNNEFIHASNPKDGVKKSQLSGYYESKYKGARRP